MWVMTDDSPVDRSATPPERLAGLLEAAARGDDAAWGELIRLYGRRVFALAKSRCRDPELAEEITQSVFVTVASTLKKAAYNERGRFEPWLFRITMNRVRDEMRRRSRQAEPTDPTLLVNVRSVGPDAAEATAGPVFGRLRSALGQLTGADREVVELRHHAQMSFKAIAELLDEPIGTVLARHHRALKKLKDLIGDETKTDQD